MEKSSLIATSILVLTVLFSCYDYVDEESIPNEPVENLILSSDIFNYGDSLYNVLTRNGYNSLDVANISNALSGYIDVRKINVKQGIEFFRSEEDIKPETIEIPISDFNVIRATTENYIDWEVEEIAHEPVRHRDVIRGNIEYNLYNSVTELGESADLVFNISKILSYHVDFHRDIRQGDTYTIVLDKLYNYENEWRGYGDIHAVFYFSQGRDVAVFRYEFPNGDFGYYDFEGKSIERQFLMSPLNYTRITSVFSNRRFHPVHKIHLPHHGVDYSAPTGTPVMATSDGVVIDAGYRGSNGNMVTIRHLRGYMTKYLHLSRIPKRVRVGNRVIQGDTIGYVGSTGVSTGPHLDYRLYKDGKPIDSRNYSMPPGPPILEEYRSDFEEWRDNLVRETF